MKREKDKLKADELSMFCYQLALMVQAGIGSEESVGILSDDARSPRERAILDQIHKSLLEGEQLSAALARTERFPAYLIRMLEIGQAAGRLDQVLSALSAYYRRESETQQSLRRAVAYPAVMAVLIAVVFLVLVARVLPVFQQVFTQLGIGLNPVAQALLRFGGISEYISAGLAVVLVVGAVILLLLFRAKGSASTFSSLFSRSQSAKAVDRSRFASAMALMLSSGLPLDEAITRTCQLLEGSALSSKLKACAAKTNEGVSFPKAVEECGIFTGLQAGLLSAGFRAGVSDQAMEELSRRCQEEADERLGQMLSRFEYGLVVVLCLAVGLVLLSVMLPLLGVLSAIGA